MNDNAFMTGLSHVASLDSAVEAIDYVLNFAAASRASDVHLDPGENGTLVRLRIDGLLEAAGIIPKKLHDEILARLKLISGARTDIHAIPQDGRWQAELCGFTNNLRVSFMPTYHGENAVIRILPSAIGGHDSFASLGFTPDHVSMICRALRSTSGLILATGPTGSGKTTTLRVCLSLKASEPISVMTLEDPVEYEVPGVRHVHIRQTFGVSFASGLRSALRQDPDVIMIGEIRDAETARTAAHTALTGHLVLSTLHTTSAVEAVVRLLDLGLERYLISATLKAVIGQRLIRTICPECGGDGDGCARCRGSGFSGRSVIAEVLEADAGLKERVIRGESPAALREYALSRGMRTISEDAGEKVDWGVTTAEEVMRALCP